MLQLAGKVAVITGASMGIGEALAKLFVQEGAAVVLSSRDISRIEAARDRIGLRERTVGVECDVRNREEIERLLATSVRAFGRVDIWVNNAGYGLLDSVATMDVNAVRNLFDTNLFGALNGMQVAARQMAHQGGGSIINVSSVAGHIPLPFNSAYAASKFSLNAFSKAARVELRKYNVNVLTVCPGFIKTSFGDNVVKGTDYRQVDARIKGGITAERLAQAILIAHLKGKREIVVPWKDKLIIKGYQLFPRLIEFGMSKLMRAPKPEVPDTLSATGSDQ